MIYSIAWYNDKQILWTDVNADIARAAHARYTQPCIATEVFGVSETLDIYQDWGSNTFGSITKVAMMIVFNPMNSFPSRLLPLWAFLKHVENHGIETLLPLSSARQSKLAAEARMWSISHVEDAQNWKWLDLKQNHDIGFSNTPCDISKDSIDILTLSSNTNHRSSTIPSHSFPHPNFE